MRSVIITIVLGAALVNASNPFSAFGSFGSVARMLADKLKGCPTSTEVTDLETKMKAALSADCLVEEKKDVKGEDGSGGCVTDFEKCDLKMGMEFDMPCDKSVMLPSDNSTNSTSGNGTRRLSSHATYCDYKDTNGNSIVDLNKEGMAKETGKTHLACIPKKCANTADLTEYVKAGNEGMKFAICMSMQSEMTREDWGKAYTFEMKGGKLEIECPGGVKASAVDAGYTAASGGANTTKKGSTSNAYTSTAMALPGILLIVRSILNF